MILKIPKTPFATRLSGSAKETQLRICNIFQWKKRRPPVWLFAFIVLVIFGCIGLVSCRTEENTDTMWAGLDARIVEIDTEQMILYVQGMGADEAVFGQRCALDCKQAAEEGKLIFVNYETTDLTAIPFDEFRVGDEIIIWMNASQKNGAKDACARVEQVQLGTQRLTHFESSTVQQGQINYSELIVPEFYMTTLDDSLVEDEAFLQAIALIVRDDIVYSLLGDKPSLSGENLIKLFQRVMGYAYPAELIDAWAGEIPLEAVEAVLDIVLLDYNESEFYGYLEFRSNCFNKETKTITLQEDELEPAITIQSAELTKLESLTAQLGYEEYDLEYSGEPSYSLEITFSLDEKVAERQALVTLYQGAIRIYGTDLVYGPGM